MPKSKPLPPLVALQEFLSYDPATGLFTWVKSSRRGREGVTAGALQVKGYISIVLKGHRYLAHRLAWLYITEKDPGSFQVDHIDRDKSNNKASNLRLATQAQNSWNRQAKGWTKLKNGQYRAAIRVDGNPKQIGVYSTVEEAQAAYVEACVKLHGVWTPNCYTDDVPQHQIHGDP